MYVAGQLLEECASASRNIENAFARLYIGHFDGASEHVAFERY